MNPTIWPPSAQAPVGENTQLNWLISLKSQHPQPTVAWQPNYPSPVNWVDLVPEWLHGTSPSISTLPYFKSAQRSPSPSSMKFTSKQHLITTHSSPLPPKWQSSPGWFAWQFPKDFPSLLSVLSLRSQHRGHHDFFKKYMTFLFLHFVSVYMCAYVCGWAHPSLQGPQPIRGQLSGVSALLLPCGFWDWSQAVRHLCSPGASLALEWRFHGSTQLISPTRFQTSPWRTPSDYRKEPKGLTETSCPSGLDPPYHSVFICVSVFFLTAF